MRYTAGNYGSHSLCLYKNLIFFFDGRARFPAMGIYMGEYSKRNNVKYLNS